MKTKRNGNSCNNLQEVYVGMCCRSKTIQLSGKRPLTEIVMHRRSIAQILLSLRKATILNLRSPYHEPPHLCIGGTHNERWIPIGHRTAWPSRANLNSSELNIYGVTAEVFSLDSLKWKSAIQEYWSLLSPQIFSDHPKRPGDEDPSAPFNMLRNVLDMNAHFGGFNHALLEAGKNLWVMNVVPTTAHDSLPLVLDRGFIGTSHNWCEAFPSYPRTYDMIHADGLLSLENRQHQKCTTLDLFLDIDRLLHPEGWAIFRDTPSMLELA